MDLGLTPEQRMVRDTVRNFSDRVLSRYAEDMDRSPDFPFEAIGRIAEVGLMGLTIPREYGGAGNDAVSYALAIEELSRVSAVAGVIVAVHNSVSAYPIVKFGTEEQKRALLPAMADGRAIGAFALTEPDAGSDAGGVRTTAVRDGDGWTLNGTKIFITNGSVSENVIVVARTASEGGSNDLTTFILRKGTPGFGYGTLEKKMGITGSDTSELIMEDARVPDSMRLGGVGDGFKIAMVSLDGGRIGIAAQAIGIARAALEGSIRYSMEREQFGRPISSFQAIQWTIADMATRIEAARHMTLHAAQLKDAGARHSLEASMAKLYASETATWATIKAVQVHGGYGYTKDYPVERFMRDAKVTEIYEGTSEVQRLVIARELLKGA
ncbi:MAG: acyl-CoA dehydrogenase family protein [Thermoplasmata archaeon]|nr:acyl-CoA dehydrogenase family protein [Thermoplasmata archaeon]